jgi:hypothetical protein
MYKQNMTKGRDEKKVNRWSWIMHAPMHTTVILQEMKKIRAKHLALIDMEIYTKFVDKRHTCILYQKKNSHSEILISLLGCQ